MQVRWLAAKAGTNSGEDSAKELLIANLSKHRRSGRAASTLQ
jgi:hypothetical protein